jgi:hypothetical protein
MHYTVIMFICRKIMCMFVYKYIHGAENKGLPAPNMQFFYLYLGSCVYPMKLCSLSFDPTSHFSCYAPPPISFVPTLAHVFMYMEKNSHAFRINIHVYKNKIHDFLKIFSCILKQNVDDSTET